MTHEPGERNAVERRRWNDDYWTAAWPVREQLTACATSALLDAALPVSGDRVVDVGCGCGRTALLAAAEVGPTGQVVAADVSTALLDVARRAVADAGAPNISFVLADVQDAGLPGAPFDLVLSSFGVMFFDHPVEAFSNLHDQVAPSGRLAFACWQRASDNPWFLGHPLGSLLPAPAPPAAGAHATGPFAFSDPADVTAILHAAGWADVAIDDHRGTAVVDRDAICDPGQPAFLGVVEERLGEAHEALERHAARFARDDGRLEVPVAFSIVHAKATR